MCKVVNWCQYGTTCRSIRHCINFHPKDTTAIEIAHDPASMPAEIESTTGKIINVCNFSGCWLRQKKDRAKCKKWHKYEGEIYQSSHSSTASRIESAVIVDSEQVDSKQSKCLWATKATSKKTKQMSMLESLLNKISILKPIPWELLIFENDAMIAESILILKNYYYIASKKSKTDIEFLNRIIDHYITAEPQYPSIPKVLAHHPKMIHCEWISDYPYIYCTLCGGFGKIYCDYEGYELENVNELDEIYTYECTLCNGYGYIDKPTELEIDDISDVSSIESELSEDSEIDLESIQSEKDDDSEIEFNSDYD
jgi:hypothetical protein